MTWLYCLLWFLSGFITTNLFALVYSKQITAKDLVMSVFAGILGPIAVIMILFVVVATLDEKLNELDFVVLYKWKDKK